MKSGANEGTLSPAVTIEGAPASSRRGAPLRRCRSTDTVARDAMKISFPYSAADHAKAIEETGTGRLLRRILFASTGFALLAAVVSIAVAATIADMPVARAVGEMAPLLALGAVGFFVPNLNHRFHRWFLARKRVHKDATEFREFSEDGFLGSSHWTHPVPWFLVDRVLETQNYFLVYAAPEGPSYVPKALLQPADVERLREFLESNAKRTGMTVSNRG